ncbi:MAG TPA: VWA domain-containing protein, partial [Pyrinomonadaceae bacterium]
MKTSPGVALLLSFILCAQPFAQQPANPTTRTTRQQSPAQAPDAADEDEAVRISTNLVQFDFVVTDKRGRQVTDLRAEEVEVLEDGRPQKLTHFSYVSTEPAGDSVAAATPKAGTANDPTSPAAPARRENVRRTIAVVVDDLGMSFQTVIPARAALRKFVEEQVRPGDLVALIRTGGEVGALQQFTSDKRQLLAAVERLRWNPCSRRGIYLTPPLRQDASSGLSPDRSGGVSFGSGTPACATSSVTQTLESLRFIIAGMRELPGRKSVVILSDSVPLEEEEPAASSDRPLTPGGGASLPSAASAGGGVRAPAGGETTQANGNGAVRAGAPAERRDYRDPLRRISELAV